MKWAELFIFGTIGLAALIGGTIWGLKSYPIFRDNVSTKGTVVELYVEKSNNASDAVYFPVVVFSASGNVKVRFQDTAGSVGASGYEVGTAVNVLYDPRNPLNARIGSFRQLWSGPLTAGGTGLIVFLLSVVLFVKIDRFEKNLKSFGSQRKEENL